MELTRRALLGAAGATVAVGANSRPVAANAPAAVASLRSAIDDAVRRALSLNAAPGFNVTVGDREHLLFTRSYGEANLETRSPVQPGSVFRIGSLTKQFTAATALRLAELGRLRLTDQVSRYLKAFAAQPAVSIAELIHHSAGLHEDDDATSCPAGPGGPRSQITLANAIAAQSKLFDFPPGTAWRYSNANFIVLGAIIEQVAGKSLGEALSTLVLARVGDTRLAFDHTADVVPGRVSGYSPAESETRYVHAPFIEISDAGGAGAMRGTAVDLVVWHQALLGGRVLAPASLQFMLEPGRLRDGRLTSANRFSQADANYGEVQYGGGLLLSPAGVKPRTISHNGFINGFSALLESNLDSGVTFSILANADVGPNLPFRAIRAAVRRFEEGVAAH